MKKTTLFVLTTALIFGISLSAAVSAQETGPEITTITKIMAELEKSQNVTTANQLSCSQVTLDQFEKLGDAVMKSIHPGDQHTYMEKMMGGEGSSTLRAAHINMGQYYLGCSSNYGMMGGLGMMNGAWGMMGGYPLTTGNAYGTSTYGQVINPTITPMMQWGGLWWNWFLILLVIIIAIMALVKYLFKGGNNKSSSDSLEILRGRYAKGEINKEEFEVKKKDLEL